MSTKYTPLALSWLFQIAKERTTEYYKVKFTYSGQPELFGVEIIHDAKTIWSKVMPCTPTEHTALQLLRENIVNP